MKYHQGTSKKYKKKLFLVNRKQQKPNGVCQKIDATFRKKRPQNYSCHKKLDVH